MIHTGVDIVEIKRIERLIEDPNFVSRVFSDSELQKNKVESLAGIFALKEAFFKATQIKVKKWREVNVKYHVNGKPYLIFDKNLIPFKIKAIDCSVRDIRLLSLISLDNSNCLKNISRA